MARTFLKSNHPLLRKLSKQISEGKFNSSQIRKIVEKMLKIAFGQQENSKIPIMVGLAAPQIGIPKRIILVDIKADGKGKVGNLCIYLNPQITWKSKKQNKWYEGCYSISGVCGIVSRPTSIKIKALTVDYQKWQVKLVEEKYTGYIARIFQHEIDHLNGKLFVDLITNPDHLHSVKKEEFPLYRNKEAWRNWPKKYPLPLAYNKLKQV